MMSIHLLRLLVLVSIALARSEKVLGGRLLSSVRRFRDNDSSNVDSPNSETSCSGRDDNVGSAATKILHFLSNDNEGEFLIQGWRWHTMALVREASRLQRWSEQVGQSNLNETMFSKSVEALEQATDYVVGFNMKGLHRIERDLFFPWVRRKVEALNSPELVTAFQAVMNQLDNEQKTLESLGQSLHRAVLDAISTSSICDQTLAEVSNKAAAIANCARSMLELEDQVLVPTIAKVVPASEQRAFNDKVIRKLGLLDSRLHLVGMYEAVLDLNDANELQLFENSIPSIPQMMIPRWRRLLYEPRVGILNQV